MLISIFIGIACVAGCAVVVSVVEGSTFDSSPEPAVIALMTLAISILVIVALIPLILANQIGYFAGLLIMDGNLNAGEAISLGWQATKRHWIKFVLLSLVAMVLSLLGVIALYVGVFVACAWLTLGQIYIYEEAFGEGDDRGGVAS
jgi:uncharacterized membrane protein